MKRRIAIDVTTVYRKNKVAKTFSSSSILSPLPLLLEVYCVFALLQRRGEKVQLYCTGNNHPVIDK